MCCYAFAVAGNEPEMQQSESRIINIKEKLKEIQSLINEGSYTEIRLLICRLVLLRAKG